jgi:PcfJ-like protein
MSDKLYGTKDGSSLVFMRNIDGKDKTIKYDFKDGKFYSATKNFNWRELNGMGTVGGFFRGLTANEVRDAFDEPHYRDFLNIVIKGSPDSLKNIGSMLQHIPKFQHIESWVLQDGLLFDRPRFSKERSYYRGSYETFYGIKKPVSIYQKEVLLFMKEISVHNTRMKSIYGRDRYNNSKYNHDVSFGESWEARYEDPEFQPTIINLCTFVRSKYAGDWGVYEQLYDLLDDKYRLKDFINLVNTHKLEYKSLFNYLITLDNREALSPSHAIGLLNDYLTMSKEMGNTRASKYPRFLKLRHDITTRNYSVKPEDTPEDAFKKYIRYELDWMDKTHAVVSPLTPEEMVFEGDKLHHCVAQYIEKVVNGVCQIMFLRDLQDGNQPLVTLEVKQDSITDSSAITQVRGDENRDPTPEEIEILVKFAKEKRLDYEQGGYDATEDRKLDAKKEEKRLYDEQNKQNSDEGIASQESISSDWGEISLEADEKGSLKDGGNKDGFGFGEGQNSFCQVPAHNQNQIGAVA